MAQVSAGSHLSPSDDRLLISGKIGFSNPCKYMPMSICDLVSGLSCNPFSQQAEDARPPMEVYMPSACSDVNGSLGSGSNPTRLSQLY